MKSVGAVIKVRDEEAVIEKSLLNLLSQTMRVFVVVVNDGSIDRTGEIASNYADVVINLPRHKESWVGRPELAGVVNAGLNVLFIKTPISGKGIGSIRIFKLFRIKFVPLDAK